MQLGYLSVILKDFFLGRTGITLWRCVIKRRRNWLFRIIFPSVEDWLFILSDLLLSEEDRQKIVYLIMNYHSSKIDSLKKIIHSATCLFDWIPSCCPIFFLLIFHSFSFYSNHFQVQKANSFFSLVKTFTSNSESLKSRAIDHNLLSQSEESHNLAWMAVLDDADSLSSSQHKHHGYNNQLNCQRD